MKRPRQHMLITPRNPVARSPLMKKGGAHGKTRAAQRRHAKTQLLRTLRDADCAE